MELLVCSQPAVASGAWFGASFPFSWKHFCRTLPFKGAGGRLELWKVSWRDAGGETFSVGSRGPGLTTLTITVEVVGKGPTPMILFSLERAGHKERSRGWGEAKRVFSSSPLHSFILPLPPPPMPLTCCHHCPSYSCPVCTWQTARPSSPRSQGALDLGASPELVAREPGSVRKRAGRRAPHFPERSCDGGIRPMVGAERLWGTWLSLCSRA